MTASTSSEPATATELLPRRSEQGPACKQSVLLLGEAQVVPLKHLGRKFGSILVVIVALLILISVSKNPNFGWSVIATYVFSEPILSGLWVTVYLTVISMVVAMILGTFLALMRQSKVVVLRGLASFYIWFVRGIPLLVQLILLYNFSALYPSLSIAIPFGPQLLAVPTNSVMTAMTAALVGLSLNEAAYMAEIIRSGLESVDEGQYEAADALSLNTFHKLTRIILPQAMRVIIPPTGNETITMLKTTSLVSVVAVSDLLYSVQVIYARNFQTIPLLLTACVWYLFMTSLLNIGQRAIERRFGRGTTKHPTVSWWGRTMGTFVQRVSNHDQPKVMDNPAYPHSVQDGKVADDEKPVSA